MQSCPQELEKKCQSLSSSCIDQDVSPRSLQVMARSYLQTGTLKFLARVLGNGVEGLSPLSFPSDIPSEPMWPRWGLTFLAADRWLPTLANSQPSAKADSFQTGRDYQLRGLRHLGNLPPGVVCQSLNLCRASNGAAKMDNGLMGIRVPMDLLTLRVHSCHPRSVLTLVCDARP